MKQNNRYRYRLINIIGIDGAGKTTLAVNLAEELRKAGINAKYRYCQYFAKLLYPIKLMAKLSVMRRTDEFKDYAAYNNRKKTFSSRYPFLARAYAFIWLFDYLLQVFLKITLPVLAGRRLVIDRYIFDIAVNLSLTTNRGVEYAAELINGFLKFGILPDLIIFIDLPEEIAFNRKDDIQDVEYLRERRERYLWLADKFGFEVIDGTQPPINVLNQAKAVLAGNNRI